MTTTVRGSGASLVVDNDFGGDPDGLVALAHVLLRRDPGAKILVTSSPLDPRLSAAAGLTPNATASRGRELAEHLVRLMGLPDIRVLAGAEETGVASDQISDAAEAIAETSVHYEQTTLLCGGPLTNIAAALRVDPALAGRARLVWVGGTLTEDCEGEYNARTDLAAAAAVFASGIPVVRIPLEEYTRMTVAVDEVKNDLASTSPVGPWLAERLLDVPPFVQLGATLTLGDSVLVPFAPPASALAAKATAPFRPGTIIHNELDSQTLWQDLVTRLKHLHSQAA